MTVLLASTPLAPAMVVPAIVALQAPLVQHSPAPQALPQAPQLFLSLLNSTQEFPQTVPSQGPQTPALQAWLPGQA